MTHKNGNSSFLESCATNFLSQIYCATKKKRYLNRSDNKKNARKDTNKRENHHHHLKPGLGFRQINICRNSPHYEDELCDR